MRNQISIEELRRLPAELLPLRIEIEENEVREDFTPSEKVGIARRIEPYLKEAAKERQQEHGGTAPGRPNTSEKVTEVKGETAAKAAAAVGISRPTLKRAMAVVEAAEQQPELFGTLVEKMDQTGNVNAAYNQMRKVQNQQRVKTMDFPTGKYAIIYADPPWQYDNSGFDEAAESQYPTMPLAELCQLPISDLCIPETVLFLWATNPLLPEALAVLKAWGFTYKTNMAWIKDQGRGKGWFLKSKHELLLIGVRDKTPQSLSRPDSCFQADRGPVHSRKPTIVYDIIDAMYTGPRIELFAREKRWGWEVWGNEITNDNPKAAL